MAGSLRLIAGAALAMATATPMGVLAQTLTPALARAADHNGAVQMAAGNLQAAERVLAASRRVAPHDPDLSLNLASVYVRQGRTAEARTLYADVLSRPDEMMTMANGEAVSAHALAARGLRARSPAGEAIAAR